MGKKIIVDDIEIELDDDIHEEELEDNHPAPENALTDEEIRAIEEEVYEELGGDCRPEGGN